MMEKNWIMTFQIQKYSQIFQKKISAERKHSVSSLMDEHAEKRMRFVGAALEFGVVLHADKKTPVRQTDGFYQPFIR